MAGYEYWNPYGNTTGGSTSAYPTGIWDSGSTSTGTGWYFNPIITVRKILVSAPEHWTDEQNMGFVELINLKTKTGWTVTLVIKGKILITDPTVEKRSMADFVPLLLSDATATDINTINQFFTNNPITI